MHHPHSTAYARAGVKKDPGTRQAGARTNIPAEPEASDCTMALLDRQRLPPGSCGAGGRVACTDQALARRAVALPIALHQPQEALARHLRGHPPLLSPDQRRSPFKHLLSSICMALAQRQCISTVVGKES